MGAKYVYSILYDYGAYEGMKFADKSYDTVDQAVKAAIDGQRGVPFKIVVIVDWEAEDVRELQ